MLVNKNHLVKSLFYAALCLITHAKPIHFEMIIYQQPNDKRYGSIQIEKYQSLLEQPEQQLNPDGEITAELSESVPHSRSIREISKNLSEKSVPYVVKSWVIELNKNEKAKRSVHANLNKEHRPISTRVHGEITLTSNLYLDLESQLSLEIKDGETIIDYDHATHRRHLKYDRMQYLDNEMIGIIVKAMPLSKAQFSAYSEAVSKLASDSGSLTIKHESGSDPEVANNTDQSIEESTKSDDLGNQSNHQSGQATESEKADSDNQNDDKTENKSDSITHTITADEQAIDLKMRNADDSDGNTSTLKKDDQIVDVESKRQE